MRVSVITISRNNAEGLRRTLDSVGSQRTGHRIEHIIVDGMSSDPSREILASLPADTLVVRREPRGVYDAINAGIDHAQGDIIGILHAGDTYADADVLQDICRVFEDKPETDFIFGDVSICSSGKRTGRRYSGAECRPGSRAGSLQPPHPSLYIRREAQCRAGRYNPDYVSAGDLDMFLRLFRHDSGLRWQYVRRNMVTMCPGGISTSPYYRIIGNNAERMRAFRENNISGGFLRILSHYLHTIKSYI